MADTVELVSGAKELVAHLLKMPAPRLWSSYDAEGDVLYLTFKRPSRADDSELTEDGVIIRYEGGQIVGLTFLNASKRFSGKAQ